MRSAPSIPAPYLPEAVSRTLAERPPQSELSARELQNAVRHASPTELSVGVAYGRHDLDIEIRDNGCGFDARAAAPADSHHYGLLGMRERVSARVSALGGKLDVDSAPGRGTSVRLRVPLNSSVRAPAAR